MVVVAVARVFGAPERRWCSKIGVGSEDGVDEESVEVCEVDRGALADEEE